MGILVGVTMTSEIQSGETARYSYITHTGLLQNPIDWLGVLST